MITILAATVLGISGSYFESRTCAIFAGPCHYSGEVMVDGGTGVMAWGIARGSYRGIRIAGLNVAAVVHAERNFAFDSPRRSVIYLDSQASELQRGALLSLVKEQSGVEFGSTVGIRKAHIALSDGKVAIGDAKEQIFSAETSFRTCLVCSMPGQLWYEPLARGTNAKVATIEFQKLSDATLGETWTRRDEPSAFVGRFSW